MAVTAANIRSSAASTLTTGTFATAATDLLHCSVSYGIVTFTSITSSPAQTWTAANAEKVQTNIKSQCRFAKNITGSGTQTVTLTLGTSTYCSMIVLVIPGMDTTAPLDVGDGGTVFTSATTFISGSFTTTAANETIVGSMWNEADAIDASYTAGAGYTIPTNGQVVGNTAQPEGACEYQVVSSIQTGVTLSMTGPNAETGVIFVTSYKQAGGAASAGLFRGSPMSGLGAGGPFFADPLSVT